MMLYSLIVLGIVSGFMLFRRNTIVVANQTNGARKKLSVIIPARNEETNLPVLLESLQSQTLQPDEIIVVDDFSEDRTREMAAQFDVRVIPNPPLPAGWTGKSWALYNGYQQSSGELLAFLDADVRLSPHALDSLVQLRDEIGGAISVVPYHQTKKWFERLSMILNILGTFAFTSTFEQNNPNKGLYGSCILVTKKDYDAINGHESVKSEVLDDMKLGSQFMKARITVNNFIGRGFVSFRMYPEGIKHSIEGFSKSAYAGAAALSLTTVLFHALWVIGLIVTECFPLFINTSFFTPLLIGYLLYTLQILYFVKYVGKFGITVIVAHMLSSLFFIAVLLHSIFQSLVLRQVMWKGRKVNIGGSPK